MKIKIGSKYEQTRAMLRERIREGNITVLEALAINHMCYFCRKPIKGWMSVLIDKQAIDGREVESKYFLDDICYVNAKLFIYYKDILLSLN